jgi:hypothetical protein
MRVTWVLRCHCKWQSGGLRLPPQAAPTRRGRSTPRGASLGANAPAERSGPYRLAVVSARGGGSIAVAQQSPTGCKVAADRRRHRDRPGGS